MKAVAILLVLIAYLIWRCTELLRAIGLQNQDIREKLGAIHQQIAANLRNPYED